MPRNRYTRLINDRNEAQFDDQISDTRRLAWTLRRQSSEAVDLPPTAEHKERRRSRLEQKKNHKADRQNTNSRSR